MYVLVMLFRVLAATCMFLSCWKQDGGQRGQRSLWTLQEVLPPCLMMSSMRRKWPWSTAHNLSTPTLNMQESWSHCYCCLYECKRWLMIMTRKVVPAGTAWARWKHAQSISCTVEQGFSNFFGPGTPWRRGEFFPGTPSYLTRRATTLFSQNC